MWQGEITKLRKEDSNAIVSVHHSAFSRSSIELSIFSCAGIEKYIQSILAYPRLQSDHLMLGAWNRDTLVGYAHFCALEATWHLNNIAVLPRHAQQGIGGHLFSAGIEQALVRGFDLLSLDVDPRDNKAISWYSRSGFRTFSRKISLLMHRSVGAVRKTLEVQDQGGVELLDWSSAFAWHKLYGFSRFRLRFGEHNWVVRRLGDRWLRVDGNFPSNLYSVLAQIAPDAGLIVDMPECCEFKKVDIVAMSQRMLKNIKNNGCNF